MSATAKSESNRKTYQPLQVMGYFWLVLGAVVLIGSFFIKETPYVPQMHGVVTNIIAGSILVFIGLMSVLCGREKK